MPIVQSDNEVEAVDLATADEHEEVVEVAKTKKPVKSKATPAKVKGKTSKPTAKKAVAKAPAKVAKAKAAKPTKAARASKTAKTAAKSKAVAKLNKRGRKRGWPTGVAKNGKPARLLVLKLLKQKLSPSEVARKAGVTPQRVYQIRKTA